MFEMNISGSIGDGNNAIFLGELLLFFLDEISHSLIVFLFKVSCLILISILIVLVSCVKKSYKLSSD
jgi:hypothetical protein